MTPPDDSSWQPATFAERGVAVPFTSPMLAGARARPTARRCDIVVPHPAGARGVYIIALPSIAEFCTPTLHDRQLLDQVARLHPLSPSAMRLAARVVSAGGAAGRAAATAVAATGAQDQQAEQSFAMKLLLSLTREGDGTGGGTPEQRTAQAVLRLAGRTGRDADAVHSDIKRLAKLVVACGFGGTREAGGGRCRSLLESIGATATAMLDWADSAGSAVKPACLHFAGAARTVANAGQCVLRQAQTLVDDPANLLEAWAAAPDSVAAKLERPGWLLDGWEGLCLTWQLAETDDQRTEAAVEACRLMPPMPPEVESWLGVDAMDFTVFRFRQSAVARQAAATSHALCAVSRNERIRAMAA